MYGTKYEIKPTNKKSETRYFTTLNKLIYNNKNAFIQNIDIQEGDSKQISAIAENDFSVLVKKDSVDEIKSQVFINNISLPLEENSTVGKIIFSIDDKELGSVNLISPTSVNDASVDSTNHIANILLKYISVFLLFFVVPLFVSRTYYKVRKNIKRRKRRKIYQER